MVIRMLGGVMASRFSGWEKKSKTSSNGAATVMTRLSVYTFIGFFSGYSNVVNGPVIIKEIMYHPTTIDLEFIEIYNTSVNPVNLFDADGNPWIFSDGIVYTFPPSTTIPAQSYIVVAKDPTAFAANYSFPNGTVVVGPYIGKLNNSGEALALSMPGDEDEDEQQYIVVDRVVFNDKAP